MSNKTLVFVIVIMVACLGSVASDIYTPSIPAISHYFGTSISTVQLSMAVFMASFAGAQLVYGPLSEIVGRRIPLFIGMLIALIGSLICTLATNIDTLLIGRCIQGLGAGAGPLFRAIMRDSFEGNELAKYGSYAVIIVIFVVPAAPTVGGYLQHFSGWRASFVFIIIYAIIALFLIAKYLQETNLHRAKSRAKPSFIMNTYAQLLKSKLFMGYTSCTLISYGAFFAWFTTGPVLLIHNLGVTPITFGWIMLIGSAIAMGLSGWINGRLVGRLGTSTMLYIGWFLMFAAGILLLLGYFISSTSVALIVAPALIFYFGATIIWPNIYSAAFTPFGHIAGYAGALYGFMQIIGGAVLGTISALLPHNTPIPLAFVFIIAPVLACILFSIVSKSTVTDSKRTSS